MHVYLTLYVFKYIFKVQRIVLFLIIYPTYLFLVALTSM